MVCTSAHAQEYRPERPYRGLFGGNAADPTSNKSLDLNVSFYGAYDDNVLADRGQQGGGFIDPRVQKSGGYGGGDLSLGFGARGERASLNLSGSTSYRYYPSMDSLTGFNYSGSAGFSLRLSGRTTFRASESIGYSRFYSFGSFPGLAPQVPGDLIATSTDFSLVERPAVSLFTSAALDHRLTQRATFTANYHLRHVDYREEDRPLRDWGGGAGLSYRLSRRASARLGYHYRRGTYGLYYGGRPIEGHDIDVGVDYSRSLSISRRTTFGFSTGSSIYRTFDPGYEPAEGGSGGSTNPADYRLRTRYMLTGNAFLNREIGRTWNARLNYNRGLHFVEGFPEPFFSDMVTMGVGGQAGRRTSITLSGAYTDGEMGWAAVRSRNYEMYTGTAGIQVAVTRMTALYVNYFYYHYQFDEGVPMPPGMGRGLDRNGIRGGLTLWLPLLR
ncbi:MAG TPA: hypothetical protein VK911_01660 [Vicinamibacterales bacterium]|nr:hypothetical protein [Vicinamibacterales bacterium]